MFPFPGEVTVIEQDWINQLYFNYVKARRLIKESRLISKGSQCFKFLCKAPLSPSWYMSPACDILYCVWVRIVSLAILIRTISYFQDVVEPKIFKYSNGRKYPSDSTELCPLNSNCLFMGSSLQALFPPPDQTISSRYYNKFHHQELVDLWNSWSLALMTFTRNWETAFSFILRAIFESCQCLSRVDGSRERNQISSMLDYTQFNT